MIPIPPFISWTLLMTHGLKISNNRNNTNAKVNQNIFLGIKSRLIHIPATSSMTTSDGSFIPECDAYSCADHVPIKTDAANNIRCIRFESFGRNQKTNKAARLPQVPGAIGNFPTKKKCLSSGEKVSFLHQHGF